MSLTSFIQQNQVLPLKKISYHFKWHFWGGTNSKECQPGQPYHYPNWFWPSYTSDFMASSTLVLWWRWKSVKENGGWNAWKFRRKNPVSFHHLLYISHVWRLWRFQQSPAWIYQGFQTTCFGYEYPCFRDSPGLKFQGCQVQQTLRTFSRNAKSTALSFSPAIFRWVWQEFLGNLPPSPNGNAGSLTEIAF